MELIRTVSKHIRLNKKTELAKKAFIVLVQIISSQLAESMLALQIREFAKQKSIKKL